MTPISMRPRKQDVNTNLVAEPLAGVYTEHRFRLLPGPGVGVGMFLGGAAQQDASAWSGRHDKVEDSGALLAHRLKGHVHDQLAIIRGEAAEKMPEPLKKLCRFAGTAPLIAVGRHAQWERTGLGRRFPVVKSLYMGISRARAIFSSVSMLGMVWPFSTRET